jgi:Spy/CpxP family protein refolding chaperone
MKQRLIVALFTIVVFCAGYYAGVWSDQKRPLPPPPASVGGEFVRARQTETQLWRDRPINRAELIKEVESLKPQLDEFRSRLAGFDAEFWRDFGQLLTPEQRSMYEQHSKKKGQSGPSESGPPLTDDELENLRYELPAHDLLTYVVVGIRLDSLTQVYRLDDAQREKVRSLLKDRRDKVIALIDSSPSPSVSLLRLAPVVQRLASPASSPQPPPAPNSPPAGK